MGAFDDLIPQQAAPAQAGTTTVQNPDGTTTVVTHNADGSWDVGQPQKTAAQTAAPAAAAPAPAPSQPGAFDDLIPQAQQSAPTANLFTDTSHTPDSHDAGDKATAQAFETYLSKTAHSIPFLGGMIDPAMAGIDATISPYTDKLLDGTDQHNANFDVGALPTWDARYQASLAADHGRNAQGASDHPLATQLGAAAGPIGTGAALGGFLSPATSMLAKALPAAGTVPTMAANAVDGGLVGGGMGYLNGQGGLTDPSRVQGAEQGGKWGVAGGLALAPVMAGAKGAGGLLAKLADGLRGNVDIGAPGAPLAASGGTDLAEALGSRAGVPQVSAPPSAVNQAYDRIYQAGQRGGATPDQLISTTGQLGPWGMLADANVPLQDFARTVATAGGRGGQIARDALDLRQLGQAASGPDATSLYSVPPSNQRIGDTLAQSLAGQGHQYDAEEAALIAQQKAAAGPAYAKAYAAPPIPLDQLSSFSGSPQFTNAYDRARAISQSEFVPQPDGTSKVQPLPAWGGLTKPTQPTPGGSIRDEVERAWAAQTGEGAPAAPAPAGGPSLDWRTLDLMKQGMDDMRREGAVQGIGANAQRATTGFTKAFVDKLDSLNPDYATARAAFSGPANALEALHNGYDYMGENPQAARETLADLAPGDQEMFRIGAARAGQDQLGGSTTANAGRQGGLFDTNKLTKLRAIFPDQQSFDAYRSTLGNENTMFDTRTRVLGGSQTDRNLTGQEDAGFDPLEFGKAAIELHAEPVTGALSLAKALMHFGNGAKMSEPVANSAAAILFNTNNNAYPEFLTGLSAAAKRAALAEAVSASPGVAGAYGGAGLKKAANQQGSNQGANQ